MGYVKALTFYLAAFFYMMSAKLDSLEKSRVEHCYPNSDMTTKFIWKVEDFISALEYWSPFQRVSPESVEDLNAQSSRVLSWSVRASTRIMVMAPLIAGDIPSIIKDMKKTIIEENIQGYFLYICYRTCDLDLFSFSCLLKI